MSYKWITDIHLNFVRDQSNRFKFYDELRHADGIIISGDISDGNTVAEYLVEMADYIQKPIYFVLGNHDYYHSDVATMRYKMSELNNTYLIYLTDCTDIIELQPKIYLCGIDGWGDSREGDFASTTVRLNDSNFIQDLYYAESFGGKELLGRTMEKLSDDDSTLLLRKIEDILRHDNYPEEIIIVTHVPPFKEACLYQGKQSSDDFLPFFCNKQLGQYLYEVALRYFDIQFTVLCGHTHGKAGPYRKLNNLKVEVGGAEYYSPQIAGEIL